ncbi:tetratricopeptide repeat protein [Candidatus Poribacteria bacterium]|nr:tetratricopeptide repeat protein [Candidatus Poribacteria bacterium]
MIAIKEARYNLAIAYLNDAQYNAAIPEFEAVLNLDADFIDAHCGLGRAYLQLNELEKAEVSAQKALSLNSDYSSALFLIDELKNAHYDSGITSLNDKQYRDAVSKFEKVESLEANFKHTHYNLGRAYIGLRQYDKAITSLQSSIDTHSTSDDVHYLIGCAYIEQRLFDESIQHLEQAINTDPNLLQAHYNLACAYRETGNIEAATNAVTETLRLDPNYKPIHELVEKIKQTHYNRGISYLNNSRYSDAIAAFQNVITLDADFTAAHYNLGVAYLKLENFARAVDVLQKTIALDRTHKAALHALALAYFGLHELENARNAAQDALKIDPNYQPAKSLLEAIDPNFTDIPSPDSTEIQDTSTEQETDIVEPQPTEDTQQDDESNSQTTEKTDTPIQDETDIKKDLDRGLIYLSNKQYNNAADAYKRVIKADPNCIDAHYGLAQTYLETGAFDDAKSAVEEALKLDPRHKPSLELLEAVVYFLNLERNRKIRKKVFIYVSIFLIVAIGAFASYQYGLIFNNGNDNNGPPIPPKPKTPILSISGSLDESSGNGLIDAGEIATLKLTVRSSGAYADNVRVRITPMAIDGLNLKVLTKSLEIKKEKRISVLEIKADRTVKAFEKTLKIQLLDRNGKQLVTKNFNIRTVPELDPIPVR